jgi:hypothetical protein
MRLSSVLYRAVYQHGQAVDVLLPVKCRRSDNSQVKAPAAHVIPQRGAHVIPHRDGVRVRSAHIPQGRSLFNLWTSS